MKGFKRFCSLSDDEDEEKEGEGREGRGGKGKEGEGRGRKERERGEQANAKSKARGKTHGGPVDVLVRPQHFQGTLSRGHATPRHAMGTGSPREKT